MQIKHAHPGAADRAEAERLRLDTRSDTIMGAPEAAGRGHVAFALLLRLDLSPETAVLFLREAPELRTAAQVWAWVETIPQQIEPETLQ